MLKKKLKIASLPQLLIILSIHYFYFVFIAFHFLYNIFLMLLLVVPDSSFFYFEIE